MVEEVVILDGQERVAELLGDLVVRHELAPFARELAEQRAVGGVDPRHRGDRVRVGAEVARRRRVEREVAVEHARREPGDREPEQYGEAVELAQPVRDPAVRAIRDRDTGSRFGRVDHTAERSRHDALGTGKCYATSRMVRAWILVGLVACRDGSAPPPPPAPATPTPTPAPPIAAKPGSTAVTPRPSLPAPEEPGVTLTVQETFEHEPIDRFWRANTEAQIKHRLPGASDVECHQTICRITVVGNQHDLAAAIDTMESEQSLRGIAQSILLAAPDKREDGTLALRAYARFDHQPEP